MKVTILKNHLSYKAGDVMDVPNARGQYWINIGLAEEAKGEKKEVKVDAKDSKTAPTKKATPKKASKKQQSETPKTKN